MDKKEKAKGLIGEFKEFISKGNVMDMAVGIIIGGAFTAIVTSLVNDILMPVINLITGGADFAGMNIVLAGSGEDAIVLSLGSFIGAIINFLLIAIVVFVLVKAMNKFRRNKEEEETAPTTKICPKCKSEINIEATKCPCCTSDLD